MVKKTLLVGLAFIAIAPGQPAGVRKGQLATAGTGGITQNLLAAKDASDPTVWVLPAAGGCGAGIAASTATVGNTFYLQNVSGSILTGVADGTITAGHILTGGSGTPGRVADTGQTSVGAVSNSTCIVGIALAGATVGNTVSILYEGPGLYGSQVISPIGSGTTFSFTAPRGYYQCTGTCTVTPPTPVANAAYEFCVFNAPGVTTAITFAGVTNVYYAKPDHSGWAATAGNTLTSTAGTWAKACIVGADATHYMVVGTEGTWTAN